MEQILFSLEDTKKNAESFLEKLKISDKGATLILLVGDLGSGKTAYTQMCGAYFGVTETITSPTFVIQKEYGLTSSVFNRLVHIDAYRLEHAHELELLGWNNLVQDPQTIIFLEWPTQVTGIIFPENTYQINLNLNKNSTRSISYIKI